MTTPDNVTQKADSAYLNLQKRSEAEYRARLKANLEAEGASEATIARCTDDEVVQRMMDHENRVVGLIFGALMGAGIK